MQNNTCFTDYNKNIKNSNNMCTIELHEHISKWLVVIIEDISLMLKNNTFYGAITEGHILVCSNEDDIKTIPHDWW